MATYNGSINGTNLGVYIGGTLIGFATSATINVNQSLRSTSSKASGGWEENMEGIRNFDVSTDALYLYEQAGGGAISEFTADELYNHIHNRTSFTLKFGSGTSASGDINYEGTAFVTSISISAPMEDTATYSVSFQGSGQLQQIIS
mgnify:FL=1|tara:strand:+ start:419 stop:856 length:438 start_codon:yes stop_codon:yes gene_type:complete